MKTPYDSYSINNLPRGCQLCVLGKKSVLFVSGVCSRNCWYCSLSKKRKNKDVIYCNERELSPKDKSNNKKNSNKDNYLKEIVKEIKQSNSKGIGITGGDPLLFLNRTLNIAKTLKNNFNNFHIHIYLPTKLVDKDKLEKLSKYIDEVRFHPEFLLKNQTEEEKVKEIIKIRIASLFWNKKDIGVELPMMPEKKQEILEFIIKISPFIGFVNLNEFEISDTNFDKITKDYKISKDTYTISGSRQAGIWLINNLKKQIKNNNSKLKTKNEINVHFCTANTKNNYQFKNRLKLYNILPYGHKTEDGTVIYLAIYLKKSDNLNNIQKEINKQIKKQITSDEFYFDKKKNRIILSPILAKEILGNQSNLNNQPNKKLKFKIERVEEFPTSDGIEVEREEISC